MIIVLRPMTADEFAAYVAADVHRYAQAMVEAGYWSAQDALDRSRKHRADLLPDGVETRDHHFYVIEEPGRGVQAGLIWLFLDRKTIPPSGFIYDVLVYEPFRGQGIGRQAMLALEEKAGELGLASLALHVFQNNVPARSLYDSLGYSVKSVNMTKPLPPRETKAA